jgi:adenylylsulfate kinase
VTGAVVWFTGLPSSGKSTLARRVAAALGAGCAVLDGDEVRAELLPSLGHAAADRERFYELLARLAALLARQGLVVLVAATAHRRAYRERARALAPRLVEVHVATPAAECARRDAKGLYARAREGGAPDLPGAGVEYEPPGSPEVVAAGGEDEAAVGRIVELLGRPADAAVRRR